MTLSRFVLSFLFLFVVYLGSAQTTYVKVLNFTPNDITVGTQFTEAGPACGDMCSSPSTGTIVPGDNQTFSVSPDCIVLRVGAYNYTGSGYSYQAYSAGCGMGAPGPFTFVWISAYEVEIY